MAITTAQPAPQASDSDGITNPHEKDLNHQQIENASSDHATPVVINDYNSGKLTKDVILAYIVSDLTSR